MKARNIQTTKKAAVKNPLARKRASRPDEKFQSILESRRQSPNQDEPFVAERPRPHQPSLDSAKSFGSSVSEGAATKSLHSLLRKTRDDEERRSVDSLDVALATPREVGSLSAASAPRPTLPTPNVTPQFDRIIHEIAVAQDVHRRKVITMKLRVPGRGDVSVRVRRGGHGAEVDFYTADQDLGATIRRRRTELTDRARARGVSISRVGVETSRL